MSGDTDADNGTSARKDVKVVEFADHDESKFQKPDHDPHGEVPAAAAHCSSSCDNPDCDTSGLLPQAVLEEASGYVRGVESHHLVCSDECVDALT